MRKQRNWLTGIGWETVVLLALVVVLFIAQLSSLFVFPQHNALRWFGDETWLMSEATSQMSTGIVRYPLAHGSTLEYGKGLILSLTWLSSFLYGLPALLNHTNVIDSGRVVTALLSAAICVVMYFGGRRLGLSSALAAFGVLLLVASRTFFFASHSARPDMLAGLVLLSFVIYNVDRCRNADEPTIKWSLLYGTVTAFLCVSSSIHLLTLLPPVALYFFFRLRGFERRSTAFAAAAGAATVLGVLVLIYYCTTGNVHLFLVSGSPNQFHDVVSTIPILRPTSRSVQLSNVLIRFGEFWHEAPQVFLLPVLILVGLLGRKRYFKDASIAIAIVIVSLSWLELEGSEINYLVHLFPILCLGIVIHLKYSELLRTSVMRWIMLAFGVLLFAFALHDALAAAKTGETLHTSNETAVREIVLRIAADAKSSHTQRVMTETPTLSALSESPYVDAVTDHFISFPDHPKATVDSTVMAFLRAQNIDYMVLYNSPVYPKDRYRSDPYFIALLQASTPLDTVIGTIGDMGTDYFNGALVRDTVFLRRVNAR